MMRLWPQCAVVRMLRPKTPDVPSKEALECLHKAQNSLSDKVLQCVRTAKDQSTHSAVKRQRQTKITSVFK